MEFHSCRSSGVRPRSSSLNFSSKKSCLSLFTAAFVRTDGTDSTDGAGRTGSTIDVGCAGASSSVTSLRGSRKPQSSSSASGGAASLDGTGSGSSERSMLYSGGSNAASCASCISGSFPGVISTPSASLSASGPAVSLLRAANTLSTAAAIASAGSGPVSSSIGCSSMGAGAASSSAGISAAGISTEAVSARSSSLPSFGGSPPTLVPSASSVASIAGTASAPRPSAVPLSPGRRSFCVMSPTSDAALSSGVTVFGVSSSGVIFFLAILVSSWHYIFPGSCEPKNRWVPSS